MASLVRATHVLIVLALLLGVFVFALWSGSWGGLILLMVGAGGWLWYRRQVALSAAAEKFFSDAGEETRLTGMQSASPSEMPVDRGADH